MRILGITDQTIDPPAAGGAERIRTLYERLARKHDVDIVNLVGFREKTGESRLAPRLRIQKVRAVQRTLAYYLDRRRLAPVFTAHYAHALLAPLYAAALRRRAYDVAQIDGIALGPLLGALPRGLPTVYTAHNVEAEFFRAYLEPFPLRKQYLNALTRMERAILRRADSVVAVSDRDRALLAASYGIFEQKIVTVPNGYDEDRFRPAGEAERLTLRRMMGFAPEERIVLFAGSRVPHNEAAVRLLAGRVAPRLPARCRLVVVGTVGSAFEFVADPRVRVTGPVPDVLPYFQAADVAVNPVESGGGTNIKVMQSLAAGLPVVSTAFGMRGLEALVPFVRIAEVDDIPEALAGPLPPAAPGLRERLAALSWGASARRLESVYEALLEKSGGAGESAR